MYGFIINVTIKHWLYCAENFKMAHNKKYSVKQRIQMVWLKRRKKSTSLTPTKFVKHFDLDRKRGKPPKQTILAVAG